MVRIPSFFCLLSFLLISVHTMAAPDRLDYDLDDDGLIEIDDLADLNEIRNNLDGASLYGVSTGCPVDGCVGFELTTDLDFDTNSDGVMDENDTYWNGGEGWVPIGNSANVFSAIFDGGDYSIANMQIYRPSESVVGLFGSVNQATLRNVTLSGPNSSINSSREAGSIVGSAQSSEISNISSSISVECSTYYCGGLVGISSGSSITGSVFSGVVTSGGNYRGGIVGRLSSGSLIENISTGNIQGGGNYSGGIAGEVNNSTTLIANFAGGRVISEGNTVGGLVGQTSGSEMYANFSSASVVGNGSSVGGAIGNASSNSTISGNLSVGFVRGTLNSSYVRGFVGRYSSFNTTFGSNYWATDTSGQDIGFNGVSGFLLEELQCPVTADNESCSSEIIFQNWSSYENLETNKYWNFGNANQLPGLSIGEQIIRDSDGDGVLDEEDAFPSIFAASKDQDGDGAVDFWTLGCDEACIADSGLIYDFFPESFAAIIDSDLDGLLDEWNASCDTSCQASSGLVLDAFLNDTDNDGLSNETDDDDDGDGNIDIDSDSDGLIEISTLAELNAIRNDMYGLGFMSSSDGERDSSGCPLQVVDGLQVFACHGYELMNNLDFDINNDRQLDVNDTYWNEGDGWEPIGDSSRPFQSVFNGNGYAISNLLINSEVFIDWRGLFGVAENAVISALIIDGPLTFINGRNDIGGVVGSATNTTISEIGVSGRVEGSQRLGLIVGSMSLAELVGSFSTGSVRSDSSSSHIGGLVGSAGNSNISSSFSTASVIGSAYVGGLVGYLGQSVIEGSFSTSFVRGDSRVGGLFGSLHASSVSDSYAAENSVSLIQGPTIAELSCPTFENDTLCSSQTLFNNWSSYTSNSGTPYWDFGTSEQLPGINLNGNIYRDSDGDGYLDELDQFPNNYAASVDSDEDGAADFYTLGCDDDCIESSEIEFDYFPNSNAASVDDDFDSLPDSWHSSCGEVCQTDSGLILDTALSDTDNDGIINDIDTDDNDDGVTDVDADSDGLIEISTIEQLDSIRYQLNGYGRATEEGGEIDSSGCPIRFIDGLAQISCQGYELINDLNFDTNNDGVLDGNDAFWNDGEGWEPLGENTSNPFSGIFNGNSFSISNLMVNRTASFQGLFGAVQKGELRSFSLIGPLGAIAGYSYVGGVGAYLENSIVSNVHSSSPISSVVFGLNTQSIGGLIGFARNTDIGTCSSTGNVDADSRNVGGVVGGLYSSTIEECFSTGSVTNSDSDNTGGLIGQASNSRVTATFSTSSVSGTRNVGGLIGEATESSGEMLVEASFATGSVSGAPYAAGLIGSISGSVNASFSTGTILSSNFQNSGFADSNAASSSFSNYWATDTSGQIASDLAEGVLLEELQCPTSENNDSCGVQSIYFGWPQYKNVSNEEYWDFGTDQQLPGLNINGVLYRDSDGDGALDNDDAFPNDYAASVDSDGDGAADIWNLGCGTECIENSGLEFDFFPDNPAAFSDPDYDGIPDAWSEGCDETCQADSGLDIDLFPNDTDNDGIIDTEDDDDNGDGFVDIDSDSDGLIDVETVEELNAIRFSPNGEGQVLIESGEENSSGCPVTFEDGLPQQKCIGYELLNDLDLDTNQDGLFDENDQYWNGGSGWEPIGSNSIAFPPFASVFEGNGYSISNLFINRDSENYIGLFGIASGAEIRNVNLNGSLSTVVGDEYTGALVGSLVGGKVSGLSSSITTSGTRYVGGLIGQIFNSDLRESDSQGAVNSTWDYTGGLIGWANDSNIYRVSARGGVESLGNSVGGLVGYSNRVSVEESFSTGNISTSGFDAGGLAGFATESIYRAVFSTGDVVAVWARASGLISLVRNTEIQAAFATGSVENLSNGRAGGLVAGADNSVVLDSFATGFIFGSSVNQGCMNGDTPGLSVSRSYWAADACGRDIGTLGEPSVLSTMQCPTSANNDECDDVFLYENWDSLVNAQGAPYWDFGTNQQLPGLLIDGVVYRDSDGDGLLDGDDPLPYDSDNDSVPNETDAFPFQAGVSVDEDLDGLADAWNASCDESCQTESGVVLDTFLNDTDNDGQSNDIDTDIDGDGYANDIDAFPLSPAASTDTDGDGAPDSWLATCDDACIEFSGLTLDTDDDNDGVVDVSDLYPLNVAISNDADGDGTPDAWNENCDLTCQSESGVNLDAFPGDRDNDGITDVEDTDDNNDGIVDADIDSDGLLEISNLDEFYAMRFNSMGSSFRADETVETGDSSGCPAVVQDIDGVATSVIACHGYELTSDLDFDSNTDGTINASDDYWNEGVGWDSSFDFEAVFDGNNFTIRNFFQDASINTSPSGLFGDYLYDSTIRNLNISEAYVTGAAILAGFGYQVSVVNVNIENGVINVGGTVEGSANTYGGAFFAGTYNASIEHSSFAGEISAGEVVGGLVGYSYGVTVIESSYVKGSLSAYGYLGGVIGAAFGQLNLQNDLISSSAFIGELNSVESPDEPERAAYMGGLIGYAGDATEIANSYVISKVGGLTNSALGGVIGVYQTDVSISNVYSASLFEGGDGGAESAFVANSEFGEPLVLVNSYAVSNASDNFDTELQALRCPVSADDTSCAAQTLYENWLDIYTGGDWDFGSTDQLPAITFANGITLRDSDLDLVLDYQDAFPVDPSVSIDADSDRLPDEWNTNCDATCQSESGLTLDANLNDTDNDGETNDVDTDIDGDGTNNDNDDFPLDPTEVSDLDGDGIGDNTDADIDGDGVLNDDDLDNSADNGAPELISIPEVMNLSATGINTPVIIDVAALSASDAVDADLEFEVSLNGAVLTLDEESQLSLPSGTNELSWVAIDDAGNRSDSQTQVVNVYPLLSFESTAVTSGEATEYGIGISASGNSPQYPIVVTFSVVSVSTTLDNNDVLTTGDGAIDLLNDLTLTIDNENEIDIAELIIPILEDGVSETDELLVLELTSAQAGDPSEGTPYNLPIDTENNSFTLTVADSNLAPAVEIVVTQNGTETTTIDVDGGDVVVTANVTDLNGNDSHTFVWGATDVPATLDETNSITFSPADMANGNYSISVIAADSGEPMLESEEVSVNITVQGQATSSNSGSSSGGGGGSTSPILFVVLLALFATRRVKFKPTS